MTVFAAADPVPASFRLPTASVVLDGVRHVAHECTAAGLSLPLEVLGSRRLGGMQRGEERTVVLYLRGAAWEEAHRVRIRLAGRRPTCVEFAFVALQGAARQAVERVAAAPAEAGAAPALAFARLQEPDSGTWRFALRDSAAVHALTCARRSAHLRTEAVAAREAPALDLVHVAQARLVLYVLLLLGLATGLGWWSAAMSG